ncbi:MAG: VanZ family protein [Prosthecobacter sp.]
MTPPRFFRQPLLWRVLLLVWAGLLIWLSEQSHLPSPATFDGIDKVQHAVYFAAGGTCFLLGMRLAGLLRSFSPAVFATVLFCSVVGALDEWHQTYTPGRSGGDVWDWTADTLGGFLGALIALSVEKWLTSTGTTTSEGR